MYMYQYHAMMLITIVFHLNIGNVNEKKSSSNEDNHDDRN